MNFLKDHVLLSGLLYLLLFRVMLLEESNKPLSMTILEEEAVGTVIADIAQMANLHANDAEKLNFQFINSGSAESFFELMPQTGILKVKRRIDRDQLCSVTEACCDSFTVSTPSEQRRCYLNMQVRSDEEYRKILMVQVFVEDLNDNKPFWLQPDLTVQFSESSPVGEYRSIPAARDDDSGSFGIVRYELTPKQTTFALEMVKKKKLRTKNKKNEAQDEIRLKLLSPLDRETIRSYSFKVTAFDGGEPAQNSSITLRILVTDDNDNDPVFEQKVYKGTVRENQAIHTKVIQVYARDADDESNARLSYSLSTLTDPKFKNLFTIDSDSGVVRVKGEIDYESHKKIILKVDAIDSGALPRKATCIVDLEVIDQNDNTPLIRFEPGTITLLRENQKPGELIAVFTVEDKDSGDNGKTQCRMRNEQYFHLNKIKLPYGIETYQVTTAQPFDREKSATVNAVIICCDMSSTPHTSSGTITIRIVDENDEAPTFNTQFFQFHVRENKQPGSFLFFLNATDNDEGINSRLLYSLSGPDVASVSIQSNTAAVHLRSALDRETQPKLTFVVTARDSGEISNSGQANVTILVSDVNDNAPHWSQMEMHFKVKENHTATTPIAILNATDEDLGENAMITYHIVRSQAISPDGYNVHGTHAESFLVSTNGKIYMRGNQLDRENASRHELIIQATDQGRPALSSRCKVTITVEDVNDCAPKFAFPTTYNSSIFVRIGTVSGTVITEVKAIDRDEGANGRVTYSFKADVKGLGMFLLDAQTGKITLLKTPSENEIMAYNLIIQARDGGQPQLQSSSVLRIIIDEQPPPQLRGKSDVLSGSYNIYDSESSQSSNDFISSNFSITIALVCATVVFICVLVIAISILVCKKRRLNESPSHKIAKSWGYSVGLTKWRNSKENLEDPTKWEKETMLHPTFNRSGSNVSLAASHDSGKGGSLEDTNNIKRKSNQLVSIKAPNCCNVAYQSNRRPVSTLRSISQPAESCSNPVSSDNNALFITSSAKEHNNRASERLNNCDIIASATGGNRFMAHSRIGRPHSMLSNWEHLHHPTCRGRAITVTIEKDDDGSDVVTSLV